MKFKCPICGCEEHYGIRSIATAERTDRYEHGKYVYEYPTSLLVYNLKISGDASFDHCEIGANFETFICQKCGHVDMFVSPEELKKKLSDYEKQNIELDSEISKVMSELEDFDKQHKDVLKQISQINMKLSSDEITVREQKELTEKVQALRESIKHYDFYRKKIEVKLVPLKQKQALIIDPRIADLK